MRILKVSIGALCALAVVAGALSLSPATADETCLECTPDKVKHVSATGSTCTEARSNFESLGDSTAAAECDSCYQCVGQCGPPPTKYITKDCYLSSGLIRVDGKVIFNCFIQPDQCGGPPNDPPF